MKNNQPYKSIHVEDPVYKILNWLSPGSATKRRIGAKAQIEALIQSARIDELERIVGAKATLNDIYGDDPRNNYGYNETQVRDAANWLRHRHQDRIKQLRGDLQTEEEA